MDLERAYRLAQHFAEAGFEGTIAVAAGEPPYAGASLTVPVPVNVERFTKLLELLNGDPLMDDVSAHLAIVDDKLSATLS